MTATQNDWFSAQQKYWETWLGTAQQSAASTPWANFFKEWQNTVSGNTQSKSNTDAFQQHFAKTGETFLNMMQQFYQATGQAKPLDQMAKEWTDSLQKFYTNAFNTNSQPFDVSEGYKAFMDNMGKFTHAWGSAAQPGKDPFGSFDPLGSFTTMPGLGYTREKQDALNALYQQWIEFQQKSRVYDAGMAKVGLEAVKKFQEYLANPPKDQAPIDTLRGVYTKWVDICEDIYARYAMSEEYIKIYGDSVNALMEFKKQQNKLTDEWLEQMNMPTRSEVDTLHERLHALRREVAELKAAMKTKTGAPASQQKTTEKKGKK